MEDETLAIWLRCVGLRVRSCRKTEQPPARAPQAVVLAVPPAVDQELTTAVLVDIVAEVRALTRVRMADAAELGAAAGALHLAAMPASGRAGVGLGAG